MDNLEQQSLVVAVYDAKRSITCDVRVSQESASFNTLLISSPTRGVGAQHFERGLILYWYQQRLRTPESSIFKWHLDGGLMFCIDVWRGM